ncbi:MAG: glucokinase [Terricaulis sp.]
MHGEAPHLVAEVSAQRCLVAAAAPNRASLTDHARFRTGDFPSTVAAINAYLNALPNRPSRAAVAICCPVHDGEGAFQHPSWQIGAAQLRRELGLDDIVLINDVAARALAVARLDIRQFHAIGPAGQPCFTGVSAVASAGQGLGLAGLDHEAGVLTPSEAGHIGLSPETDFEEQFLHMWRPRLGRVSREHMLSASGLTRIYLSLAELSGETTAILNALEVAARAQAATDARAVAAVEIYCGAMASFAGDAALMLNAKRVVLAGAFPRMLLDKLDRPAIRERFEKRGPRPGYMQAIPLFVTHAPHLGLIGAQLALNTAPTTTLH